VALLLPACGAAMSWAGWLIAGNHRSGAPWTSYAELLGLAAAAAGLAVLAWWVFGLLLALAGAVLHRTGHLRLAALSFAASPAFLRRLVVALLGLHLLAVPAAHAAAGPGSSMPASSSADTGRPDPYFTVPEPTVDPHWQPRTPPASPGPLPGHAPAREQPGEGTVTVRAGDTLWDIAARDLGALATDAEIAAHWPRWYAANRDVIGADPAFLVPGQILNPPPER
jgi:hypothetical protein